MTVTLEQEADSKYGWREHYSDSAISVYDERNQRSAYSRNVGRRFPAPILIDGMTQDTPQSRLYSVLAKADPSAQTALWGAFSQAVVSLSNLSWRPVRPVSAAESVASKTQLGRNTKLLEIVALGRLSIGWAGEGSVPPSPNVVLIACGLLMALDDGLPLPEIAASGDGEIGMIWIRKDSKVELSIDLDGIVAWVAKFPPARDSGAQIWQGQLPLELHDWIRSATV